MHKDPVHRRPWLNPDTIERKHRPPDGKRPEPRRAAEAPVERTHDRSAREPVIEVTEHNHECAAYRFQIVRDLSHLKAALAQAEAKVRGEHVDFGAVCIDRRRERASRLPVQYGEIDTVNFDEAMARENDVPKTMRAVLSRRA